MHSPELQDSETNSLRLDQSHRQSQTQRKCSSRLSVDSVNIQSQNTVLDEQQQDQRYV